MSVEKNWYLYYGKRQINHDLMHLSKNTHSLAALIAHFLHFFTEQLEFIREILSFFRFNINASNNLLLVSES